MRELLSRLYTRSKDDYCILLSKYLDNNQKKFIITANPEIIRMSQNDENIKAMLLNEDNDIVPDGISVVKAARKLGIDVQERITGVDIASKLLELLNNKKKSLYLFGAKREVLDKLLDKIKTEYPKIKVLGSTDGYVSDKDEEFKKVVKLNPDACLVALGVPAQEQLISRHIDSAKKGLYIGVGGTFDVLSGTKKRAPKIMIKLNLEWLYRLIKEPSRIKRLCQNNIKFMIDVNREKKNY